VILMDNVWDALFGPRGQFFFFGSLHGAKEGQRSILCEQDECAIACLGHGRSVHGIGPRDIVKRILIVHSGIAREAFFVICIVSRRVVGAIDSGSLYKQMPR